MILLSGQQSVELALPLIELSMGEEIYNRAWNEFSIDEDCSNLWGLFDQDKLTTIIGFGSEISTKKTWLGYFAVHPNYRCKGYGTKALNFIEQEAKKRKYKWILVETYEHPMFENAIRLYKKSGYKKVGYLADYLDDDSNAIYLKKCLGE